jgi:cyclopropane-fatty-acyl-phospholipid synthase
MPELEGGTLVVRLPDGATRRFGSGPVVRMDILSARFFRRLSTRAKLALGESYTAGEWDTDDLVAFFELLLRNAEAARERHPHLRRFLEARPRVNRRTGFLRARQNIQYHYDL